MKYKPSKGFKVCLKVLLYIVVLAVYVDYQLGRRAEMRELTIQVFEQQLEDRRYHGYEN